MTARVALQFRVWIELLMADELQGVQEIDSPPSSPTHSPLLKKISNTLTNLTFSLKNNSLLGLQFASRTLIRPHLSTPISLLGRQYPSCQWADFLTAFRDRIWFSYRSAEGVCEDAGWGCMIRVVQMMMAEAIRRDRPGLARQEVIELFREQNGGGLSLKEICRIGQIGKRFIDSDKRWCSSSEVVSVGGQIIQQMKTKGVVNMGCQLYSDRVDLEEELVEESFPRMVAVHCQIPQAKTIPEEYIYHLSRVMGNSSCIGMATGQGGGALYVIGTAGDWGVVLDPHYVQGEVTMANYAPMGEPVGVKLTELSSSFTLGFYIRDKDEWEDWLSDMHYAVSTSMHSVFELHEMGRQVRKGSGDFQVM